MPLDVQPPLKPPTLITGHAIPESCPFCSAPRWMISEALVAFACHSTAQFFKQLPGERRNPKLKQTLKCLAIIAGRAQREAVDAFRPPTQTR